MKPYHLAWLSAHPERTEAWLRDRLVDGFDVHHLDADHDNNDPSNLVLIECADHMMLHNGKSRMSRIRPRRRLVLVAEVTERMPDRLLNGMLSSAAKRARKVA